MTEGAKEAQRKYKREYMRKWRAANPDKVAKNNEAYWEKKARQEDKMDIYAKARMKDEYLELQDKYTKLCAFLKRVEEGSSPIHDDYPVGELYKQQVAMEAYLDALSARLAYEGVET